MREPWHELTARYAQLIVGLGANVQPRQRVIIACQIEHADMARAVADAAYRAGASRVSVEYDDPHVQRFAVEHAPADALGQSLPHEFEAIRAWARDEVALIRLTGNPDPDLMRGLDPDRLAKSQPVDLLAERLRALSTGAISLTVAAAPNPGWAQSIFGAPDLGRLWHAVAVATRLNEPDPVASWREHLAALAGRRDLLNERRFDRVRLRGPGTDIVVGLSPRSRWSTAEQVTATGRTFVINLPTEEVFTSPDWRRADGRVRTTAPFVLPVMNALVEGLELELASGAIVSARAARGEAQVQAQLDAVPRSRHLGELAIVDGGSRVRSTGVLFRDILFDENAGCHLAWGQGFAFCFDGAVAMTAQERIDAGLNQSPVHVDIVVGGPDVEVDGLDATGQASAIVRADEFMLS